MTPGRDEPDAWVIGEALIDIVCASGKVEEVPGGSPANVAVGLAKLGVPTAFLGYLGKDERGRRLVQHLAAAGVELVPGSDRAPRTSTATVRIDETGGAHYEFDMLWALPDAVRLPASRILHTGSIAAYLEPGGSSVRDLLATASSDTIVSFDPNIRPSIVGEPTSRLVRLTEQTAALSTVTKLSDEDAEWLYPGRPVDAVIDRLLECGPELVSVTRGGHGAILATRRDRVAVPGVKVPVVDTVGAGDTYTAALLSQLLSLDLSRLDAAQLRSIGGVATVAAGVTVSRAGADLPSRADLDAALACERVSGAPGSQSEQ